LHPEIKTLEFMKITVTTKAIKSKEEDAPNKAHLCFRLRDKEVDIKVRSDIEVMTDYWDNETLSYRRTKVVPSDEQKQVKALVKSIIDTLTDSFDSATADVTWAKAVIDSCISPVNNDNPGLTTVISRMEQYLANMK
jgi:hypothetical protein